MSINNIPAKRVLSLARQHASFPEDTHRAGIVVGTLDKISAERAFHGLEITGPTELVRRADRILAHFGFYDAVDYRLGIHPDDYFTIDPNEAFRIQPRNNLIGSMKRYSIPEIECERICSFFREGEFPSDVLDAVIAYHDGSIQLHPDKYPWHNMAADEVMDFLKAEHIDSAALTRKALAYFESQGQNDIAILFRPSCPAYGYEGIITQLLENYALQTFHDIKKLSQRKEVRF